MWTAPSTPEDPGPPGPERRIAPSARRARDAWGGGRPQDRRPGEPDTGVAVDDPTPQDRPTPLPVTFHGPLGPWAQSAAGRSHDSLSLELVATRAGVETLGGDLAAPPSTRPPARTARHCVCIPARPLPSRALPTPALPRSRFPLGWGSLAPRRLSPSPSVSADLARPGTEAWPRGYPFGRTRVPPSPREGPRRAWAVEAPTALLPPRSSRPPGRRRNASRRGVSLPGSSRRGSLLGVHGPETPAAPPCPEGPRAAPRRRLRPVLR